MIAPVSVRGLFEAHLIVSDLDRSIAFYRDVVGLSPALEEPPRGAAFLWIGSPGKAMLGLWSLGSAPLGVMSHVAFSASLEDVLGSGERLRSMNVTPLSFFATETDEPSVIAWMPAAAVYFRDRDGNLLEYLAMLDAPPDPDADILPWSEWTARSELVDPSAAAVRVVPHTGPRSELRELFAMAEDSDAELDSYLEAGQVLVAVAGQRVVGHLQLVDDADARQSEIKNMAVEPALACAESAAS
jgi:lactoylglutathione lyase